MNLRYITLLLLPVLGFAACKSTDDDVTPQCDPEHSLVTEITYHEFGDYGTTRYSYDANGLVTGSVTTAAIPFRIIIHGPTAVLIPRS